MKFGQFIEYNMKIFLMKNYPMVEKLVPETFIKKSKLHTSLDQQTKMS